MSVWLAFSVLLSFIFSVAFHEFGLVNLYACWVILGNFGIWFGSACCFVISLWPFCWCCLVSVLLVGSPMEGSFPVHCGWLVLRFRRLLIFWWIYGLHFFHILEFGYIKLSWWCLNYMALISSCIVGWQFLLLDSFVVLVRLVVDLVNSQPCVTFAFLLVHSFWLLRFLVVTLVD